MTSSLAISAAPRVSDRLRKVANLHDAVDATVEQAAFVVEFATHGIEFHPFSTYGEQPVEKSRCID
jgi:hypothetical protein